MTTETRNETELRTNRATGTNRTNETERRGRGIGIRNILQISLFVWGKPNRKEKSKEKEKEKIKKATN